MLNYSIRKDRKVIMTAAMLEAYQQYVNKTIQEDDRCEQGCRQSSEALYEQDESRVYELGYN
ncbi:MAG: hypothetical protein MJK15_14335 [Colwellia sp.]|nr:hypothetical protein [Colwellia sp.]